ncbi:MAG TPA: isoprenylcysteine carboxylmethyltransferase family protein [Iamia sp.]|nr:isoprenylcysteine carboxylmethyltransferase family protein [Iamia sp.]
MTRAAVALALLVLFGAVGFGWRTVVQLRRHGDTGWRFTRTGIDRIVAPALAVAFVLLGVGPVVALVGEAPTTGGPVGAVVGAVLALGAGVLTVVAQVQMGASWRIGVEHGERTELVTGGLFGLVRNPIFTGMVVFAVGLALLLPNLPTLLGAALALATIEVQVRLVEEPNLVTVHGEAYRRWAGATGRFLPGLGRL